MNKHLFLISNQVIIILFIFSITVLPSVEATEMWQHTYGRGLNDKAYSLIQTNDGGYALVGSSELYNLNSSASYDVWLVKTDAYGNMIWNQTYGEEGGQYAYSLVQTIDEGYAFAGITTRDGYATENVFWLLKTDAYGNMIWNQTYAWIGINPYYCSLVQTSDGGYAFAGSTFTDLYLIKTDAYGNMIWNQTYGGTKGSAHSFLVQTNDGGYALAGNTDSLRGFSDFLLIKTDAYGNMIWNQTYGGFYDNIAYSFIQTSDGGFALAGSKSTVFVADFWLVKTDAYGNMIWNQTYARVDNELGDCYDIAYSLVQTNDGGYALAGSSHQTNNEGQVDDGFSWLVKTDLSGNMIWNQIYGKGGELVYSLIQTSDTGFALAGLSRLEIFGSDFWLVKTNSQGFIPEFSSWTIVSLFFTTTLFIIIFRKVIKM